MGSEVLNILADEFKNNGTLHRWSTRSVQRAVGRVDFYLSGRTTVTLLNSPEVPRTVSLHILKRTVQGKISKSVTFDNVPPSLVDATVDNVLRFDFDRRMK